MDIELLIKIVSVLIAAVTAQKAFSEFLQGTRRSLEHDYKFAKEFFKDVDENKTLHPYLREKGFQAIAGSRKVSGAEVEYLLTMSRPSGALRDYSLGRSYLAHFSTAGETQISFKSKYRNSTNRFARKLGYFGMYMTAFVAAFSPLILAPSGIAFDKNPWLATGLGCLTFLPLAFLCLREGVAISRAEALVENQHKFSRSELLRD